MHARSGGRALPGGASRPRAWLVLLGAAALSAAPAAAQEAREDPRIDDAEIARRLTNPIAQIVAIPVDLAWDQGVGPEDALRFTLSVRPLVPVSVTDDWNIIGRFVLPLVSQPVLRAGGEPRFGLGDVRLAAFLSPDTAGPLVWGVGPAFVLPTSSTPGLGAGKWLAGPTGGVLLVFRHVVVGVVVEHLWSFADTSDVGRDSVNVTSFRPLAAYTTSTATTFGLVGPVTANWNAPAGEKVTAPVQAEVSQVIRFGPLPLSVGVGGGYFVARPTGGPEWRLSLSFTLTLPSVEEDRADRDELLGR